MSDLYLNPATYDIEITNGEFTLCETLEDATAQKVYITLNTNKGAWRYNILFGVPWLKNDYNDIQLAGKVPKGTVDSHIKLALLRIDTVINIESFTSEFDPYKRVYTASGEVTTEQGVIPFTTELGL